MDARTHGATMQDGSRSAATLMQRRCQVAGVAARRRDRPLVAEAPGLDTWPAARDVAGGSPDEMARSGRTAAAGRSGPAGTGRAGIRLRPNDSRGGLPPAGMDAKGGGHDAQPEARGVGRRDRRPDQARAGPVVRRLAGRARRDDPPDGPRGDGHPARWRTPPQQRARALPPRGRRPGRGPHLHLLRPSRGRRPHQQLGRPGRDEGDPHAPVRRRDGRPDHVRDPLLDGSRRVADREHRRRDHGLALCRRQHAGHDAHRHAGPRGAGRGRRLRPRPPLGRRAARPHRLRTPPGRTTWSTSTSATSPTPARSGRSGRATAATPCSARSATPCGSRRSRPATRAGSPSTC